MMREETCQFNDPFRRRTSCTRPAHCKVIWTLWPFGPDDHFDEDGRPIPRSVWLCLKHYNDWRKYLEQYAAPPTPAQGGFLRLLKSIECRCF